MCAEMKSPAARAAEPRPPTYPAHIESHDEETNLGSIQIHSGVMAVIARTAALRVPGVADVVGSLVGDMAGKIGIKSSDRGVQVDLVDDQVTLTLSLLVDYGAFIPKVAWQVQTEVRRAVEALTGKTVKAVNITVRGLKTVAEEPAAATPEEDEGVAP